MTSTSSSSGTSGAAAAPIASTTLPPSNASSMPSEMFYTSLSWLSSATGVPRTLSETPPTSPQIDRTRSSGSIVTPGSEQRRKRQEEFLKEKNKELEELRQKTAKIAHVLPSTDESDSSANNKEENEIPPSTPLKKPTPSTSSSSASFQSPPPSDASILVSPEKRRAKKLSSLQYPIFSVYWWDVPSSTSSKSKSKSKSSSSSDSLGFVLLGGGGGKKGAGIDSGMLVCSVLPSSSPVFSSGSSPIRMSTVSSKSVGLLPVSFLDSNDFLIGSILPHPSEPYIAVTVGAGTALLQAEGSAADEIAFHYRQAIQTDFHKELNAQGQAWSPSGKWLVTGGEDRCIRFWSYPSLSLIGVCSGNALGLDEKDEQHRQPILALHVNHDGTRLVSCAGDGHVKIWNTSKLEGAEDEESEETESKSSSSSSVALIPLIHNLTIPSKKGSILKFQVARFYGKPRITPEKFPSTAKISSKSVKKVKEGDSSDDEKQSESESESEPETDEPFTSTTNSGDEYLITIASQIQRGGGASYLVKYSTDDFTKLKQVHTGASALTTMEISDDIQNPYVALASTDGQVAIYSAESMTCLKRVNKCHDLPTTALAFSPARLYLPSSSSSTSSTRWLISASADKSVALIEVPAVSSGGAKLKWMIVILLIAILMAYLLSLPSVQEGIVELQRWDETHLGLLRT